MTISLIAVISINGKITRGLDSSVSTWASKEDANFFKKMISQNDSLIMGNNTYKVMKSNPNDEKLRIVITNSPEINQMSEIPGQIEFTKASPKSIIANLKKRQYKKILILGGSQIYSQFLDSGIVTDIYLTVEPTIFNNGLDLLSDLRRNVNCYLIKAKILNEQGTLLLHYKTF